MSHLATMRASLYGVRFSVCCQDLPLLQQFEPGLLLGDYQPLDQGEVDLAYSVLWEPELAVWQLKLDRRVLFASTEFAAVRATLFSELHHSIATLSPYIFVHAGSVVWDSRVILFPGRSFSGKTTLVQAMLGLGAEYFSDEYAVLDPETLRVFSFPRALGVRGGPAVQPPPRAVALSAKLGSVWFLSYRESAVLEPRPMTVGEATLAMFENTISAVRFGPKALDCFSQLFRVGALWCGTRGDAGAAALSILDWETAHQQVRPE